MKLVIYVASFEVLFVLIYASPNCQHCINGDCYSNQNCTRGCQDGFYGKYCDLRCPDTCTSQQCKIEVQTGRTICEGDCENGHCGSQCLSRCPRNCRSCDRERCRDCTSCNSGLYGSACSASCYDKCLGFECDMHGQCLTKCSYGWYGENCSLPCSSRCKKCDRDTGECRLCLLGMYGNACEHRCPLDCLSEQEETTYISRSGCTICNEEAMKRLLTRKATETTIPEPIFDFQSVVFICVLLAVFMIIQVVLIKLFNISSGRKVSCCWRQKKRHNGIGYTAVPVVCSDDCNKRAVHEIDKEETTPLKPHLMRIHRSVQEADKEETKALKPYSMEIPFSSDVLDVESKPEVNLEDMRAPQTVEDLLTASGTESSV